MLPWVQGNDSYAEMNKYHSLYTRDSWHSMTNFNEYETLTEENEILTLDSYIKIKSIERWISEPKTLYNLCVDDFDDTRDDYYTNEMVAGLPCP